MYRGHFSCRYCNYEVTKYTPQGLGMARENHMRKHKTKPKIEIECDQVLKYPQLTCKQDKRYKLCDADIKKILKLGKSDLFNREIGVKFNVSDTTIWGIFHQKKVKESREKTRINNNKRYHNDEKYREYHSKKVSEHIKIKRKINPEYNKWTKLRQRKWRKENPEKSNNYAKNYRERQKESNRLVGM